MKDKRKRRGLIFIICGIAIIAVMFIPFFSINQGPNGFLRAVSDMPVVVRHTYSAFDFVYILLSSEYSLNNSANPLHLIIGIMCFAVLCIAIILILMGIILVTTKKSVKQDKLKK